MTQFLLLQTQLPTQAKVEGLRFDDVLQVGYPLTEAAATLFSRNAAPIWKVALHSGEADELADEARDAVLRDEPLEQTRLGRLLVAAISQKNSFCLFWADDFLDLPRPRTREQLFALLEDQLRIDDGSNYELYAQWHSDA